MINFLLKITVSLQESQNYNAILLTVVLAFLLPKHTFLR